MILDTPAVRENSSTTLPERGGAFDLLYSLLTFFRFMLTINTFWHSLLVDLAVSNS